MTDARTAVAAEDGVAAPIASAPISRRAWQVLAIASTTTFLVALDTTIVAVALPEIAREFPGTPRSTLQWIFTAYNVGLATLLLLSGKLADRYGRKRMFLSGFTLFLVGSVLAGLAPSVGVLIAARVVQAVGGSMASPSGLALLLNEFPQEKRSMALGIFGATAGLSAAAAPTLGALIIHAGGWRWAFLVNMPGVSLAVFFGIRILRESYGQNPKARFDPIGVPVGSLGVGLIVFGIAQREQWGWTDARIAAAFAGGALAIAVLIVRSLRHPSPLLDLTLFQLRSFSTSVSAHCMFAVAFFGWSVLTPTFFTSVWGYTPLRAGFAMAPAAFLSAIISPLAGRQADRIGHRWLCTAGTLLAALALLNWAFRVHEAPHYWTAAFPALVLSGVGSGMSFSTYVSASMRDIDPPRFATAGSARNTIFQVAIALGISIAVALVGEPKDRASSIAAFHRSWRFGSVMLILAAALMCTLYRPRSQTTPR